MLKNKNWTNSQNKTIKTAMNSHCSNHRHNTQVQNTCISKS